MYWLAYRQGAVRCVLIARATSLVTARLMASMGADVIDSHFVEGHELLPEMAGRVPTSSVGRLLSADEALELVAAMVKRRARRAARYRPSIGINGLCRASRRCHSDIGPAGVYSEQFGKPL